MDLRDYSTFSKMFYRLWWRNLGWTENLRGDKKLPHSLVFLFPTGKWVAWKNVKTSNIAGIMQPIFFIFSPCFCENNWLLDKNFWDNLVIIDERHSKGNVSQFCIYISVNLGLILTRFNHNDVILACNKMSYHQTLEFRNVGDGDHLQKSLYLSYYTNDFY